MRPLPHLGSQISWAEVEQQQRKGAARAAWGRGASYVGHKVRLGQQASKWMAMLDAFLAEQSPRRVQQVLAVVQRAADAAHRTAEDAWIHGDSRVGLKQSERVRRKKDELCVYTEASVAAALKADFAARPDNAEGDHVEHVRALTDHLTALLDRATKIMRSKNRPCTDFSAIQATLAQFADCAELDSEPGGPDLPRETRQEWRRLEAYRDELVRKAQAKLREVAAASLFSKDHKSMIREVEKVAEEYEKDAATELKESRARVKVVAMEAMREQEKEGKRLLKTPRVDPPWRVHDDGSVSYEEEETSLPKLKAAAAKFGEAVGLVRSLQVHMNATTRQVTYPPYLPKILAKTLISTLNSQRQRAMIAERDETARLEKARLRKEQEEQEGRARRERVRRDREEEERRERAERERRKREPEYTQGRRRRQS